MALIKPFSFILYGTITITGHISLVFSIQEGREGRPIIGRAVMVGGK
jgi:hypothetical protein